ncbi:hypothetical protein ACP70R_011647 [Stipagrostis hirtigluma subsp. patula]
MESERKRACLSSSSSCSAEDRLSALPDPDGVLDKILSCLKARQMVQTSVLAKRWRHLWRAVRSLDIDQLEIISTASTKSLSPDEQEKFDDFVDNLLAQRYGSLLDRFQLHLGRCYVQPERCTGTRLKNYYSGTQLKLTIEAHENLNCIKVAYEVEPEKFPIFENLRTLLIDKCDLSDNFQMLHVFLKNSPVLQEVTVRHCKLSSGSTGDGGMAKQDMVPFQFQNLVNPQFRKLKSIIVYEDGDDICQLVNVLLDNSGNLKENKITLTKVARTA